MKPLIIIGPSGVGKGTIINELKKRYPNTFQFVLSYTTRSPRTGQIHGEHYNFISSDQFEKKHKVVFGNKYGSSRTSLHAILNKNKIPIFDIDIEGMIDIRNSIKKNPFIQNIKIQNPQTLCILPPSFKVLRQRLTFRKTQTQQVIQKRMKQNAIQIEKMTKLKDVKFITNFQYQLTIYGIQIWLSNHFNIFKMIKNEQCKSFQNLHNLAQQEQAVQNNRQRSQI